jgi:hypothetical protein
MLTAPVREEAAPTAANSDTEITTIYSHQSTTVVRQSGPFRVWLARQWVRLALRRADGTPEREQAVIRAYDRLVAAEHMGAS